MMSLGLLRILFLVQTLVTGIAILNGHGYLEWQQVSAKEIASSRDAIYSIKNLLSDWWFFKGACGGIAACVSLMAILCRKEIIDGGWYIKAHWMVQVLPISVVLVYGRGIL